MAFPYIFTFYSFKGGVGRSMAAANVAYALASRGRNVLLVDMDLEAPGLSTFFRKSGEVTDKSPLDILDLLGWADGWVKTHPGEYPDLDAIAKEGPNIGAFFLPVPREKVPKPRLGDAGRLDLLLVDTDRDYLTRFGDLKLPELSRDRIVRMSRTLWAYFKTRWFPREVPEYYGLSSPPEDPYDYVLVDSRTGLTEIGALCIGPLADRLVVFTGLNVQNLEGTADFLRTVGVTKVRDRGDPPHDEADAPPSDPNTPPRLSPKPTILVASPVPIGETALKLNRLEAVQAKLNLRVASTLTYHPLLAVRETILVRDLPGEYLAMEYGGLADQVMAMVEDHAAQLARSASTNWEDGNRVAAVQAAVRLTPGAPTLGQSLLRRFAGDQWACTQEEFISGDRMYRILASQGADARWIGLINWGKVLRDWADSTGDEHMKKLRLNEALSRYDEAAEVEGIPSEHKAALRVNRGIAYRDMGDSDREISEYEAVIEDPTTAPSQKARARINLGVALAARGEATGAITEYTVVIEDPATDHPEMAIAYFNRGLAYRERGDRGRAIADWGALIADTLAPTPQRLRARLMRGLARAEAGDASGAYEDFRAVVDSSAAPVDERAQALAGQALLKQQVGDWQGSAALAREALALAPQLQDVRGNLGLALLRLGRTEEALREYDAAVRAFRDAAQLDKLVLDRLAKVLDPAKEIPGAAAVLEMVERRKQEIAAAQQKT